MKEQGKKKGSAVVLFICAVVFLLLGVVMFITDMDYLLGEEAIDLNEYVADGASPHKDDHVKVNSYAVLGKFAETKHRINGIIPIGTDSHYILWLDNDAAIAVTVKNKKTVEKLDQLENETWDALNGNSEFDFSHLIELEGKVSTMDSEIAGYFRDYLSEIGFTDSGFDIYTVTIDATETRLTAWMYVLFFAVFGVACIVGGVFSLKEVKQQKNAEARLAAARDAQAAGQMYNPTGSQNYSDPYGQNNAPYGQSNNQPLNSTWNGQGNSGTDPNNDIYK